jgi:hypothetical protein
MSCCNGLLIQVKEVPAGVPTWMMPEGKLYLDLNSESGIALGKSLGELTDVNQIADEAAVGLVVPMTKKNRLILDSSINPNAKVEETKIPIAIFQGGSVIPFDQLVVVSSSDEDKSIQCELYRGEDHWISKASSLFVKDINDLNDVYWPDSPFDIQQHWIDAVPYVDDDLGYVLAPVDYSGGVDDEGNTGWMKKGRMIPEDLRPWVSDVYLLEKGFCSIGWGFYSAFHAETDYANHLYSYLLGESYGEDPQLLASYQIFCQLTPDVQYFEGLSGVVFDAITEDGFGALTVGQEDNLNDPNSQVTKFRGIGVFDFNAEVIIDTPAIGAVSWAQLQFVKKDELTGERKVHEGEKIYFEFSGTPGGGIGIPGDIKVSASWENVNVAYDDSIYVQLETHITFNFVAGSEIIQDLFMKGGSFTNTPRRALPVRGYQTNLSNVVDPKLNFLDFFKACIFDFDGKIVTDYTNRRVVVYPPESVKIYNNEAITGFYQTTNIPLEDVVCDSLTVTNAETSAARYALIKFKDSNDPSVEAEPTPNNVPLFARLIDRGEGFKEETQEYTNPLIEPTTTGAVKMPFDEVETSSIILPRLWDNDEGRTSFDVGFRKLYFWESQPQYINALGGQQPAKLRLMNQVISSLPYGFQIPKAFKVGLVLPSERYCYGAENDDIDDFYFFFWRFRSLFRDFKSFLFKFQHSLLDYKAIDFRKWYTVNYDDHPYVGRIKGVTNFDLCTGLQEVEFFPSTAFIDCPSREDVLDCPNNPGISIIVDEGDCCIRGRADDTGIVSPIGSDEWSVTLDGLIWSPYTPNTPICDEQIIIFRRYTTFTDGCPPKARSKQWTKDEICANLASIVIEYDEPSGEVSATGTRDFQSVPDGDTWQYSIDGLPWVPYTEGDGIVVPPGSTICFNWIIPFENCCPNLDLTECFSVPTDGQCSNNTLNLLLVDQGSCLYVPELTGSTSSIIGATVFEISKDDGTTWTPWNGGLIEPSEFLKVRAMVFFCDDCPPLCLEVDCPQT